MTRKSMLTVAVLILLKIYLKIPLLHYFLGQQAFIVAKKNNRDIDGYL